MGLKIRIGGSISGGGLNQDILEDTYEFHSIPYTCFRNFLIDFLRVDDCIKGSI